MEIWFNNFSVIISILFYILLTLTGIVAALMLIIVAVSLVDFLRGRRKK